MLSALSLLAFSSAIPMAEARSGGIDGVSQEGCYCHTESTDTTVTLSAGRDRLNPMQISPIKVKVTNKDQVGAGINVAAEDGSLFLASEGQISNEEFTHTEPAELVDGEKTWLFLFRAGVTPGKVTISAAGNAVDKSGDSRGDAWAFAEDIEMRVFPAREPAVEPLSDDEALALWLEDWEAENPDSPPLSIQKLSDLEWEGEGEAVDFSACSSVPGGTGGWLAPLFGLVGLGLRRRRD